MAHSKTAKRITDELIRKNPLFMVPCRVTTVQGTIDELKKLMTFEDAKIFEQLLDKIEHPSV